MKKIAIVLGTRPEIMKNYSVVKELKKLEEEGKVKLTVIHTNQHYDINMSASFFADMGYNANFVLQGKYTIGNAISFVTDILVKEEIDLVIVNGDTSASLIGAVSALYTDTGIAHIEAGLRAYDKQMYEERNRIMVDATSHYLLTYTELQAEYLKQNKELRGHITNVGNTTVDLLEDFDSRLEKICAYNYFYVTLHRKEFTDSKERMIKVFETIKEITEKYNINAIFPMHPRTKGYCGEYEIDYKIMLGEKVNVVEPVPVFESLSYEKHAEFIMTDSGCIQEEAYIFGTPCITVRENTERPETVKAGANIVTGFDNEKIKKAVEVSLENKHKDFPKIYGEYGVGKRIVEAIINFKDIYNY